MVVAFHTSHVVCGLSFWPQTQSFKQCKLASITHASKFHPESPKRRSKFSVRSVTSGSGFSPVSGARGSSNGIESKHLRSVANVEAVLESEVDAADVVLAYYDAVNERDLDAAIECFAPDCVIEDMIYSEPFVGKQVFREYLGTFCAQVPKDLVFVVDKISRGSPTTTGLTWHAELNGKSFPFSRGCSLYECAVSNGKLRITYGRDIPESSSKPGGSALVIIRSVVWLAKRFPSVGDLLAKF